MKNGTRSKYNVGADKEQRTYDGITFDSRMEMMYYRDVILPLKRSGEIAEYELQKKYTLQPGFLHDRQQIRPIVYVADFYIKYGDGRELVVDIKGCADNTARLKRKLFWYTYPDLPYVWLTHVVKYGGWVDYDTVTKLRKENKKKKERDENE